MLLMDMCSPAEFAQAESEIVTQLRGIIRPLGYSVAHGYACLLSVLVKADFGKPALSSTTW